MMSCAYLGPTARMGTTQETANEAQRIVCRAFEADKCASR